METDANNFTLQIQKNGIKLTPLKFIGKLLLKKLKPTLEEKLVLLA